MRNIFRLHSRLAEILYVVFVLALFLAFFAPFYLRETVQRRHDNCLQHQQQLAFAIFDYALEHDERLPANETALNKLKLDEPAVRRCPASAWRAKVSYAFNGALAGMPISKLTCADQRFLLADGRKAIASSPADLDLKRHPGGMIVTFADGHAAMRKMAKRLFTQPVLTPSEVWACGRNKEGQLGTGNAGGNEYVPVQVQLPAGTIAIAAGPASGLALRRDGTVWSWGSNDDGELGRGVTGKDSPIPAQVPGLQHITAIAMGYSHSLALARDGVVWEWGNGTTKLRRVAGIPRIASIDTYYWHNLAVASDGSVWAWGNNIGGQLGESGSPDRPVQVKGLPHIKAVAAGGDHSLALAADGSVWTWGGNQSAQLGDGTVCDSRPHPKRLPGISRMRAIDAGIIMSVALTEDGAVWFWGNYGNGWPDKGTKWNRPNPLWSSPGTQSIAIAAEHLLTVEDEGTIRSLRCETDSEGDGELGTGHIVSGSGQVLGLSHATAVAAGEEYSLFLQPNPQDIK